MEVANAGNIGTSHGWALFVFSNFPVSTSFDTAAHEYTHGVQTSITGASVSQNEVGAIKESYADIIGNTIQHILYPDDDTNWEIGEETGAAFRSMSDPHSYLQPEYVGDIYFVNKVDNPSSTNDKGGVHINNSILSKICYDLIENGVSVEDNFNLWTDTFAYMTPELTFKNIYAYVRYSASRNNLEQYRELINESFEKANIEKYDSAKWSDFDTPEGCVRVSFDVTGIPEGQDYMIVFRYGQNNSYYMIDQDGKYTGFAKPGPVNIGIRSVYGPNENPKFVSLGSLDENGCNYTVGDTDETIHIDASDLFSNAA